MGIGEAVLRVVIYYTVAGCFNPLRGRITTAGLCEHLPKCPFNQANRMRDALLSLDLLTKGQGRRLEKWIGDQCVERRGQLFRVDFLAWDGRWPDTQLVDELPPVKLVGDMRYDLRRAACSQTGSGSSITAMMDDRCAARHQPAMRYRSTGIDVFRKAQFLDSALPSLDYCPDASLLNRIHK